MVAQPVDAVLREILAQMILLVVRRLDLVGILDQPRLPLRRLAGEKTIEIVETVPGRPAIEWPHRSSLIGGSIVPLADGCRFVTVVAQDLCHRRRAFWNDSGIAIPVHSAFCDRAIADTLMIASRQQRCARWGADRSRMEAVVTYALFGKLAERPSVDLAAKG